MIIRYKKRLWILTNVHVIAHHHELQVITHDGVVRDVELHDSIPEYDIALLTFEDEPDDKAFQGVPVVAKRSRSGLKSGTWVIATGSPLSLGEDGRSVATLGVVSGLDRYLGGRYQYSGAIQHDAEVNPGNSGGPLWDIGGNFIGINGKIATTILVRGARPTHTGASFALPVHQVAAFLKRLVDDEDAEAGFLGVDVETAIDAKGRSVGARILGLHRRSPLVRAGYDAPRKDDVITSIGVRSRSNPVYTASDLHKHLSLLTAGQTITVRFRRDKRSMKFKVTLTDRPRR